MSSRNLVLCLDGTSNRYKRDNTNVLKLFAMLARGRPDQLVYYQPGVGTITPVGIYGRVARRIARSLDLALAVLLEQHVSEAYRYLMRTWEPRDRVYVFGFSRGAYAARVLAGMLHKVGLLPRGNEALVPFAWDLYKQRRADRDSWGHTARFKRIFGIARPAPTVECLGLWDTVSSVRYLWRDRVFDHTRNNPSVAHVRHAVAIDERRAYFRQNLWAPDARGQGVREVWFAGVHCDVGGGYLAAESGLANVALGWMVDETRALPRPVHFDPAEVGRYLTMESTADAVAPDALASRHESLRWCWWPIELVPKRYADARAHYRRRWHLPLGRRRVMPEGAYIHHSVQERLRAGLIDRSLLPSNYRIA